MLDRVSQLWMPLFERDDDDARQKLRKMLLPLGMAAILSQCFLSSVGWVFGKVPVFLAVAMGVLTVIILCALVCFLLTKQISDAAIVLLVGSHCVLNLFVDWGHMAVSAGRSWPLWLLAFDFFHLMRINPVVPNLVLGLGLVWIILTGLEAHLRFGLLELVPLVTSEERSQVCACDNPPCARQLGVDLSALMTNCTVLGLHFLFTRTFATQAHTRQQAVERSIAVAEAVSTALSQYDLEKAEKALEGSDLPSDLHVALQALLRNLRSYEPYLPQSCLAVFTHTDDPEAVNSPTQSFSEARTASSASVLSLSIPRAADMVRKDVTVLAANVDGSLRTLWHNAAGFEQLQRSLLRHALVCISDGRGIIDHFHGDHISASWNASRFCTGHQRAGIAAGLYLKRQSIEGLSLSVAVAAGPAHCGDIGLEKFVRYHITGGLLPWCGQVLQLAKAWGRGLVADDNAARGAMSSFLMQLLPVRVEFHKMFKSPTLLFDVVAEAETGNREWMYIVGEGEGHVMEKCNDALRAFLLNKEGNLRVSLEVLESIKASPLVQSVCRTVANEEPSSFVLPVPVPFPPVLSDLPSSKLIG